MSQKSYPNLSKLPEFPFPVHLSAGTEECAQKIAERFERAYGFLRTALAFEAQICILVLAPEQRDGQTRNWPNGCALRRILKRSAF